MIDAADRTTSGGADLGLGVAWLVMLGAALLALHALGHGGLAAPPCTSLDDFRAWLDERDTPTAAFAMLRLGALAVAWYLVGIAVLGWSARILRSPNLNRLASVATLPSLRRLMGTVAGLGLSASTSSPCRTPDRRPAATQAAWPSGRHGACSASSR